MRSGKLRALARCQRDAPRRCPNADDGGGRIPDVEMSTWYGISAPAGTPREMIDKLHAAIAQTLKSRKRKEKIESQGAEIFVKNPDDYAAYLKPTRSSCWS